MMGMIMIQGWYMTLIARWRINMSNLIDMWCKKYEEFLGDCTKDEDECEELAAQCADDCVQQYMEQKEDFELQRDKEDV